MKVRYLGWSKTRIDILFLCIAAGVMTFAGAPFHVVKLWRIAQAPVTAIGTVTLLNCHDHGRLEYAFVLDGQTIPGSSRFVEDANCPTLRLGQRVNVSYERGVPTNNHAFASTDNDEGRETRAFWTATIFLSAFVTLGPLFLVFVARLFLRVRLRLGF